MHGPLLLDHFQNPRNAGELPAPAAVIEVMNPICGDILKLWARWEDGKLAAVTFKARGCTASVACGSVLTELLIGRTKTEAAALTADAIDQAIGGLIPESKHAAVLCRDAVKALTK